MEGGGARWWTGPHDYRPDEIDLDLTSASSSNRHRSWLNRSCRCPYQPISVAVESQCMSQTLRKWHQAPDSIERFCWKHTRDRLLLSNSKNLQDGLEQKGSCSHDCSSSLGSSNHGSRSISAHSRTLSSSEGAGGNNTPNTGLNDRGSRAWIRGTYLLEPSSW